MPLPTHCWMWMSVIYQCWRNYKAHYRFMGDKGAATVNVLALAVTLFCAVRNLKAAPSVR